MHEGDPFTEAIKYTSLTHKAPKSAAVLHVHPQQLTTTVLSDGAICLVSHYLTYDLLLCAADIGVLSAVCHPHLR